MKGRCEEHKIINDSVLQQRLWDKLYEPELGPNIASETAFPQQNFENHSMLVQVLLDSDFQKFVLFSEEEQVIGLGICCNNLEKVRDIARIRFNPEFYAKNYPDLYKEKRIYYFPTLVLLKEYQKEGYLYPLGHAMVSFVQKNQGVSAFDHSIAKNPFLGQIILHMCYTGVMSDAVQIVADQQVFVLIGPDKYLGVEQANPNEAKI